MLSAGKSQCQGLGVQCLQKQRHTKSYSANYGDDDADDDQCDDDDDDFDDDEYDDDDQCDDDDDADHANRLRH